ncbi:MAG: 2-C-methyl-D-erythritol 2,4-cyclodiphosphate synthase [Erysipelotrichaceae bacterium]|nr:2-C-methyl-D-erythritol 2,4-cyclodiphosphate synthase [Erysipelotrichaceae bacterium]
MIRIGQSKDIHRLVEGRKLILGGVEIPHYKGLLGHSDADCLTHAVIESIIGALGLKDIGTHFPDTDPRYEGVSSLILLEHTYQMMEERGYEIGNIDALVVIEKPKLAPHIEKMRENIAAILKTDVANVNIKATRGEGLGYIGNEEGAEAYCVCLLVKK